MGNLFKSSFLFSIPSALKGVARLLDLAGTLDVYNKSRDGSEADAMALWCDWVVVGDDLRTAMDQVIGDEAAEERTA